ncbi:MAG: L,D-transpeptidase family protein, partial [Steroidobacteraceae bacterium]
ADTLVDVARRFDLGYREIGRANPGVDMWLPGAGRAVVLPTQFVLPDAPREGIVINIAAMRLYYFPRHERGERQVVLTHPIGIGKIGWRTPVGVTRVLRKVKSPTWRPPTSIIKEHREEGDDLPTVVGPGPDNPLGDRAFYLGWSGYLIHGTNKPAGVGLRVSHGCVHLFPEDIDALFDKVPVGTPVRVVNQPFVFGWHDGQLYMQAFGSLEDDHGKPKAMPKHWLERAVGRRIERELARRHLKIDEALAAELAQHPRGVPVPVTEPDASLGQVLAAAMQVRDALPQGANWDGITDLPADQMNPPGTKQAARSDAANASQPATLKPISDRNADARAAP